MLPLQLPQSHRLDLVSYPPPLSHSSHIQGNRTNEDVRLV